MSKANLANRPVVIKDAAVTATATLKLLVADKKMKLHGVKLASIPAITEDAANNYTLRAQVNGVAIGNDFITNTAIDAYGWYALDLGEDDVYLEKGQVVEVVFTKNNTAPDINGILAADIEIIGH